MIVLGIETSCDETAAAVVEGYRNVLSSVVYSQVDRHRPHGGVVPEIACREHTRCLPEVVTAAMREAAVAWQDLDAVAVTYGPGLSSSLLVGLAGAKALALRCGADLIGINHLEAHLMSVFLDPSIRVPEYLLPARALVVSGGHTCLLRLDRNGAYRSIGQTLDDAAGEAFDKGAVLLGLGYPGGPAIERAARGGNPMAIRFPRALTRPDSTGESRLYDFSFSGLKTALLYHLRDHGLPENQADVRNDADIAASYQEAIVDVLVKKTTSGLEDERAVLMAGGVSQNDCLRKRMASAAAAAGKTFIAAQQGYCTDNAAMIAALAAAGGGKRGDAAHELDAQPGLAFDAGRLWLELSKSALT